MLKMVCLGVRINDPENWKIVFHYCEVYERSGGILSLNWWGPWLPECPSLGADWEVLSTVGFKSSKGCRVVSGSWNDPYSGKTVTDTTKLDTVHMVLLKEAHQSRAAIGQGSAKDPMPMIWMIQTPWLLSIVVWTARRELRIQQNGYHPIQPIKPNMWGLG